MELIARMHAWNDGKSIDVRVGEYEDERAAQEAALRFRRRFADSIDAMMLYVEVGDLDRRSCEKEARAHGGEMVEKPSHRA